MSLVVAPLASVIKSIQNGFIDASPSVGAGEDSTYIDVTITAVVPYKCMIILHSGLNGAGTVISATARLGSATNMRISRYSVAGYGFLSVRYTIVEFN